MAIPLFPVGNIPNRLTDGAQEFTVNADMFCAYVVNTLVPGINNAVMGDVVSGTFNALTVNNNALISGNLTVGGTTALAGAVTVASGTLTVGGGQVFRAGGLGAIGAIIEDQKASGTAGGAFTSGADRTRDLNTFVYNGLGLAAISGNQFVLPAGTYEVNFEALAYEVNGHQSLLYNVTEAAVVGRGMNSRAIPATSPTVSAGVARFTISGNRTFELRHRGALTGSFGQALSFSGVPEVYARVVITKVA